MVPPAALLKFSSWVTGQPRSGRLVFFANGEKRQRQENALTGAGVTGSITLAYTQSFQAESPRNLAV
jgi:hypothetical protein